MKAFIVAVSSVAVLAAACSSQTAEPGEPESPPSETSRTATKSPGHVGDTLDLTRADGSKVAVVLTRIINPATPSKANSATDNTADKTADKTYVATELTITDIGTTTVDGDVNVNVVVIGSDDQRYVPDLSDVAECKNFEAGTFHLDAGESASGCVVFALPRGITPAKVQYRPSAGFAEDSGEWLIVNRPSP